MTTKRVARGAVVLCGGQSSRMGRPKALLPWRGRTLIESVVSTLEGLVADIVVVGHPSLRLPHLACRVPLRIVVDREPGLGPLAGIREGLEASSAERVFVISTDAPFLEPAFVEALFERDGAVAAEVDGFVQPVAAVYPTALAAEAAALLAADRRRPLWLLEAASFTAVRGEDLPGLRSLTNLNTPSDYLAALAEDAAERSVPLAAVSIEFLGIARLRSGAANLDLEVGTLATICAQLDARFPTLHLLIDGALTSHYLISLDGRVFLRDLNVPIGPGERISIMDAAAGG